MALDGWYFGDLHNLVSFFTGACDQRQHRRSRVANHHQGKVGRAIIFVSSKLRLRKAASVSHVSSFTGV
jgi:hypothetical protein